MQLGDKLKKPDSYLQMKFNGEIYAVFDGKSWLGSVPMFMADRYSVSADVFVVRQTVVNENLNKWTVTGYLKSPEGVFCAMRPVDLGTTTYIAPVESRIYVAGHLAAEFKLSCLECGVMYFWGLHNSALCPRCLDVPLPQHSAVLKRIDITKYH